MLTFIGLLDTIYGPNRLEVFQARKSLSMLWSGWAVSVLLLEFH